MTRPRAYGWRMLALGVLLGVVMFAAGLPTPIPFLAAVPFGSIGLFVLLRVDRVVLLPPMDRWRRRRGFIVPLSTSEGSLGDFGEIVLDVLWVSAGGPETARWLVGLSDSGEPLRDWDDRPIEILASTEAEAWDHALTLSRLLDRPVIDLTTVDRVSVDPGTDTSVASTIEVCDEVRALHFRLPVRGIRWDSSMLMTAMNAALVALWFRSRDRPDLPDWLLWLALGALVLDVAYRASLALSRRELRVDSQALEIRRSPFDIFGRHRATLPKQTIEVVDVRRRLGSGERPFDELFVRGRTDDGRAFRSGIVDDQTLTVDEMVWLRDRLRSAVGLEKAHDAGS